MRTKKHRGNHDEHGKIGSICWRRTVCNSRAKILASKDAQKEYVYTTASALREKEDVMSVVTNIKEIAGDVLAGAKAFNEKRAAEQAEVIEDTAEKAE